MSPSTQNVVVTATGVSLFGYIINAVTQVAAATGTTVTFAAAASAYSQGDTLEVFSDGGTGTTGHWNIRGYGQKAGALLLA